MNHGEINPESAPKIHAVLFVCTMNAVRSPIAEALARLRFGNRLYVDSAGITKAERDGFALAVLREAGVAFEQDEPHDLDEIDCHEFDLVVTLSPEADRYVRDKLRLSAIEILHWPIEDATEVGGSREQRLDVFRRVRATIDTYIFTQIAPRVAG